MHFNISGTPHLAVLWGNLAGDDARRGFTGNRAALGMSMGGGALTGALSGAGLGAAVGSAVPGIGTVAGGVVGGACGALVGGAGAGLSYAGSHWH